MKKRNTKAFTTYINNRWTLFPLHKWDAVDSQDRSRGKTPLHGGWSKNVYNSEETLRDYPENNKGVQLREDQLVIDVDPRNGGDEGFANLIFTLDLDPTEWPHVRTGSGGSHYYLTKPPLPVLDSLPDFEGVEFKSKGRQVVSAGSIHPNGEPYAWDPDNGDPLASVTECPRELFARIKRPERPASAGGGELAPHEVGALLSVLRPEDFREYGAWWRLSAACHDATLGEARQEWTDWSTLDPKYKDHARAIGELWDALHSNRPDKVGVKTLYRELHNRGLGHAIKQIEALKTFGNW